jgi:glycosyltransferase involved in cell wall biosynthesis
MRLSDRRRRISIVMPSAEKTGGAEESLCQLIKSPASQEIKFQVIFLEDGSLVDWAREYTDQTVVAPCGRTREIWRWWSTTSHILKLVRAFSSDLILGWMTKGHVYGGLAAWRGGMPCAWFQMGIPEYGLLDKVSRLIPANAIIACSSYIASLQRKLQPNANVFSVPLGVDVERFLPVLSLSVDEARRRLGLPKDRPIIGIVGRLQAWKGMHVVLDALPCVLEQYPTTLCLIVGGQFSSEPDYPRQLRDQIRRLEVENSVVMAGAQINIPIWMQAMDIVLHASDREPFGIVVVEALSLGKTVIATRPGGPEEIIQDGSNGILVEFGDPKSLASAIVAALDNPMLVSRALARKSAERFSSDRFAAKTVGLLHQIIESQFKKS